MGIVRTGGSGLHPSNLHDNPYAVGAVDFTGDMPVILGPDGPSLEVLPVRLRLSLLTFGNSVNSGRGPGPISTGFPSGIP